MDIKIILAFIIGFEFGTAVDYVVAKIEEKEREEMRKRNEKKR